MREISEIEDDIREERNTNHVPGAAVVFHEELTNRLLWIIAGLLERIVTVLEKAAEDESK